MTRDNTKLVPCWNRVGTATVAWHNPDCTACTGGYRVVHRYYRPMCALPDCPRVSAWGSAICTWHRDVGSDGATGVTTAGAGAAKQRSEATR